MAPGQGQGAEDLQGVRHQLCGQEVTNAARKTEYNSDPSWVHCAGSGDKGCENELQLRVDMEDAYQSTHVLKDRLPKLTSQVMTNIAEEPSREYPYNSFITELEVVRHTCDTFLKAAEGKQPPSAETASQ